MKSRFGLVHRKSAKYWGWALGLKRRQEDDETFTHLKYQVFVHYGAWFVALYFWRTV